MKTFFEDPPSSTTLSNDALANGQSKVDQEMGSSAMLSSREALAKNSPMLPCCLHGTDRTLARSVAAEAVGTFILMFSICGIVASMQLVGVQSALLEYAATAGLAVIIIIYSVGAVSGAHVNPAVTIAFATVGPFPWPKVPLYILAQLGGSLLATFTGKQVYGLKAELLTTRPYHGSTPAFWAELIATLIIVFLVASLSNDVESLGKLTGFVVGVAIGLGVLITGPVSGGSLNPARSLAPAIIAWKFDGIWIYLVAPTIGAIGGTLLYRILRLQGWSCNHSCSSQNRTANLLHCHSLHQLSVQ